MMLLPYQEHHLIKMFVKHIPFTPKRTKVHADQEIELQQIAATYGFAPNIHDVKKFPNRYEITMDKIDSPCLADVYGDDPKNIPKHIWKEIYNILVILYEREGIEYIDITSYNFIEHNNKVYIIDFGDALYTKEGHINWFLKEFLDGDYGWNPDFA